MRRKDREKSEDFALNLLNNCCFATLGMINSDGLPYCIPISPVVLGKTVYFHCAKSGEKLDCITLNPNVCISCAADILPIPIRFTTKYKSAVAFGKCFIVDNVDEKLIALRGICDKYAHENMPNFDIEVSSSLDRTCVCRIDITQITGKEN